MVVPSISLDYGLYLQKQNMISCEKNLIVVKPLKLNIYVAPYMRYI